MKTLMKTIMMREFINREGYRNEMEEKTNEGIDFEEALDFLIKRGILPP